MDFVEPPFGGEGVEVPLVSATVMRPDDDEWYSFATRLDPSQSQEEIAGFIQSWLYFGLLAVLAEKTIDGRDYSTSGKRGSTIVSSQLVAATLVEMKLGVLRLPQSECMDVLERHKTILVRADEAVRRTEEHFDSRTSGVVDLILLSVKVLIGTVVHSYDSVVDHMFEKLCGTTIQWYDIARRRRGPSKAADRALEAKMMENGWCVHQIDKILSTFSYQTAYYFARLPRPRSARLEHDRCGKASCKGWDSKPGDTSACHATDNCTCSTVSVSSVEVAKIIRSNQIPLISIEEDVHGSLSLKLHTKTRSSKYVAISHVWADGLGNAFENGLPTCQLRMLQTYLGQISKDRPTTWSNYATSPTTTLFWMDTLCIPVQVAPPGIPLSDQDLREIKGKAIDKMNIVYSSSSHTLVLDAELRAIPVSADNPTKLAYSLSCGWTTRSWTLQEGCLPPLTVYALADGIYSHEARQFGQRFSMGKLNYAIRFAYVLAKKRFTAPKLVMAARGLTPDIVARDFDYPVHRDIYTSFATRNFNIWDSAYSLVLSGRNMLHSRNKYAEIWNELLDRSSSQPADIPAIFANLIGISAYEVLKRDSEEKRVALVIRQQAILPVEILYNTGPRIRGRLHAQRVPTVRQAQEPLDVQDDVAEESIGLLNVSEPEAQAFKNGWVPATIDGDAISQSLSSTKLHLQVLKDCLQVRNGDKEYFPCMFSTTDVDIPTSEFILKRTSKCQAKDKQIVVTRVIDPSTLSDSQAVEETVQGHCFIYDSGSLRAMSLGLIDDAPGAHMVIIGRSKERLTLRYSEPIRLTRITRKPQNLGTSPIVECQCNIHESKQFVDIVFDAEDLGPLLDGSTKNPSQLFLEHWFNPIAVFGMHYYFSGGLSPFIGTLRPQLINVAWFVMPILVYFYQHFVVKGAARRLFLAPLNDRGQFQQSSRSTVGKLRHGLDTLIAHPWSVILVGPVLDGLFWLALKASEGREATIRSKKRLVINTIVVVYWYLFIGAVRWKVTRWFFFVSVAAIVLGAMHDLWTEGLSSYGFVHYVVLFANLWMVTFTMDSLRSKRR